MKYKIGYVDENPAQIKKYKRELKDKFEVQGYDIPKGLSLKKLLTQIYASDIDLLLIDYQLTDKGMLTYNGDQIAREFEKVKPRFPVLIFTQHHDDAFPVVDNPNIIYEKSDTKDLNHFSNVLIKNIENYRKFISERKQSINKLITKSRNKKLTAKENHTLFDNQIELQQLNKNTIEVPFQLLDPDRIEQLTKVANEAENLVKTLKKKK